MEREVEQGTAVWATHTASPLLVQLHEGRMTTMLLGVLRNRLTLAGLLCCVWVATNANTASAQAFTTPDCRVQSGGNPTVWEIKGLVDVKGLPANAQSVYVTFFFQTKAVGGDWQAMSSYNQNAAPMGGTVSFDTGFKTFGTAPLQGTQYRVVVSGVYFVANNPVPLQLAQKESVPVTPIP